MKKTGIFALCAALFLASALLSGCQKKAAGWNGWLTDFEKAEKEAAKKGKNIFLLFSGEDWDGKTSEFRAAGIYISKTQQKGTCLADEKAF